MSNQLIKNLKAKQGFTLIEVVIVLAIAALIITVVLQAVTSAQRSSRDNNRKQEAGRVVAMLEQYASNNNGVYPVGGSVQSALTNYDSTLVGKYTFNSFAYSSPPTALTGCPATVNPGDYIIIYNPGPNAFTPRDYRLAVCLEVGGTSTIK